MEKRQIFIDAMTIYVDPNSMDEFFWICKTGRYQDCHFRIKCNKVSWIGQIRIPSVIGPKWKRITGRYYVKKDSIKSAIKFYKKYK